MLMVIFCLIFMNFLKVHARYSTQPPPGPEWTNLPCLSDENECHLYTLSKTSMSYTEARDACAMLKFHLVFLETAKEQALVRRKLMSPLTPESTARDDSVNYWLGVVNHTVWAWPGNGHWPITYKNWTNDESKRNDSSKTVSFVTAEGNWQLANVNNQHFALCEGQDIRTTQSAVNVTTSPTPDRCAGGGCLTTSSPRPSTLTLNTTSRSLIQCAAWCSRETNHASFIFHKANKSCECQVRDSGVYFEDIPETGTLNRTCYKREGEKVAFRVYRDAKTNNCP